MIKLWPKVKSDKLPLIIGCNNCEDGYIKHPIKPIGYTAEPCDCLIEYESLKESRELYRVSKVPDLDLIEWNESDNAPYQILLNAVENDTWLFMHGDTGSGKTYTSIVLSAIALLKEKSVYFGSVPQIMDKLRPNELKPKLRDIIKHNCSKADILVLDDIGQEKASDWVREQLFLIIDDRYNRRKPIIFTSNFSVENLQTTTSKAIYSRVKGNCVPLLFDSEDRRLSN